MAPANVDLVRSLHAAWERGDFSSAEWADPEIEYAIIGGPTPGRWTGLAGMAESVRGWLSAWEQFHIQAEEYLELDNERVLVRTRYAGRGKTSGLKLEQMSAKGATLFQIRGGKVTRHVFYLDRDRALADLGLASKAGSPEG